MRIAALTMATTLVLAAAGCGMNTAAGQSEKVTTLAMDKPVAGEITSRSGTNYNDGSRYQLFTIDLKEKQLVELSLGGALDGALAVFLDGTVVAAGSSGEQAGTVDLTFRADTAGKYRVAVSGDGASAYGPFRLQARELTPYSGEPLVGTGDITDVLAGKAQEYTLRVEKTGMFQIDLGSTAFDTVLTVNGNGVEVEDDDGGERTNSRVNLTLEPGTYTLGVRGLEGGETGLFRLNVRQSELPEGLVMTDGTTLPTSGKVDVMLGREDGTRSFVLVVERAGKVRLDALSRQVDTTLEVTGNGVNFEDDDGGQGTNARLEMDLRPGRYEVRVASLEGREGLVELRVSSGGAVSAADDVVDVADAVADHAP